jgi:hypothetical protein
MRLLLFLAFLAFALPGYSQSLSDAFNQGTTFGQTGNAAARAGISSASPQSIVPNYIANPPETSYFGSPGLGPAASTKTGDCATTPGATSGYAGQGCNAVQFSQTNPGKRANFDIAPNDPLLTRAKTITADPQAIAGNLAGTYSGCSVQTQTTPDIFETAICHQYRTTELDTCEKVLIVTPTETPGCTPGQFLTRISAYPCDICRYYLALDFTCGEDNYLVHAFSMWKAAPDTVYMDLGTYSLPGTVNSTITPTVGPTFVLDYFYFCYQATFSQTCNGATCTIDVHFTNPCLKFGGSSDVYGTFPIPVIVSFTDSWDNQCAALEARSQ